MTSSELPDIDEFICKVCSPSDSLNDSPISGVLYWREGGIDSAERCDVCQQFSSDAEARDALRRALTALAALATGNQGRDTGDQ